MTRATIKLKVLGLTPYSFRLRLAAHSVFVLLSGLY